MDLVTLKHLLPTGEHLEATFAPNKGMNLISYKHGDLEVIDQSTRPEFDKRSSGLGPLIGPHFYQRKKEAIPKIPHEERFPEVALAKKLGRDDPFSHGIARYAPWNYFASDLHVEGHLTSVDTYQGVPLNVLEGTDFSMDFSAHLKLDGLHIRLHVTSESPSIVGLHYYYALVNQSGIVTAKVADQYNDMGTFKPMVKKWTASSLNDLHFDLSDSSDYGFLTPNKDLTQEILLETGSYVLKVKYKADHEENSFQLYHPQDASFVCIEPLTAKNPRGVVRKTSRIDVHISILPKD